jgi:hypothetical protein
MCVEKDEMDRYEGMDRHEGTDQHRNVETDRDEEMRSGETALVENHRGDQDSQPTIWVAQTARFWMKCATELNERVEMDQADQMKHETGQMMDGMDLVMDGPDLMGELYL